MNASDRNPTPDQAEMNELVAYLDGELVGDDRVRIEQRVGTDPEYRRRLVELEQSWNLLDSLPVQQADQDFAQTTVTMAAVAAQHDATPTWKSKKVWLAGVLAVALGFVLASLPLIAQRRSRLRDVPVINNMELYLHADNFEFLQLLDEEGIFAEVEDEQL